MDLTGDRRGQSIQIGAIILFGALIILLSTYQAFVVPDQNRGVEFNHNQEVQQQMQDLRNEIVSASGGGDADPVTIQLGTQYPSRAITINPGPPGGSLRTVGTSNEAVNLTLRNARVAGEAGDYWNQTRAFNTGALVYSPNYNEYASAPDTVYEQTTLYNRFDTGNITLANQTFIDGTDISLVFLNGSLSRGGGNALSVDLDSASTSTETVEIKDEAGTPITLEFVSKRPATHWDFLEGTEATVTNVNNASTPAPSGFHTVEIELDTTKTYTLQLTKVGIGRQITDDDTAYLTDIEGRDTTVTQGETTKLTLAVRDKYNNPPDNATEATINAEVVGGGSLDSTSKTPGSDGRVTFTYTAPEGTTGDQQLKFSYGGLNDGTFGSGEPQDVSLSVTVQSSGSGTGGGSYTTAWTEPPFTQRIVSDERNFSSAADVRNGITAGTPFQVRTTDTGDPVAMADIDYAVGSSANATFDPSEGLTNATGYNETALVHLQDGVTRVYAASGGSGDKTRVTIDRLLNESFEDSETALVSNGWYYNTSGVSGSDTGNAGVRSVGTDAVAGSRVAFINGSSGGASPGLRGIELNYTLDTSRYDSLALTYVARDNGPEDELDENLRAQYQASDGSWVTVDNITPVTDGRYHYRRAIVSVANASHNNFKIRFAQGETTATDEWQIDAIDLVGVNESVETDLNQAPKAHFRYSPDSPNAGETVNFDANRSDDPDDNITSYKWDFGNGETGTGEENSTSYPSAGTYDVTLTVTDEGRKTSTTTQSVVVSMNSNQPPSASFTATPDPAQTGETISLDASGSNDPDGSISSYEWDLDNDGQYDDATGSSTTTSYSTTGEKTIGLRVTDDEGATATATRTVTIAEDVQSGTASDFASNGPGRPPEQTQTFTVTLGDDLSAGEEITIDLSDTDQDPGIDYTSGSAATSSGTPGTASFDPNTYTLTYSADGNELSDDTLSIEIDGRPDNNAVGNSYTVTFTGADSSSATDTFSVS